MTSRNGTTRFGRWPTSWVARPAFVFPRGSRSPQPLPSMVMRLFRTINRSLTPIGKSPSPRSSVPPSRSASIAAWIVGNSARWLGHSIDARPSLGWAATLVASPVARAVVNARAARVRPMTSSFLRSTRGTMSATGSAGAGGTAAVPQHTAPPGPASHAPFPLTCTNPGLDLATGGKSVCFERS
jgi:hypothetical protein